MQARDLCPRQRGGAGRADPVAASRGEFKYCSTALSVTRQGSWEIKGLVGGGGVMCLHTQSSMSTSSEVAPWQAHAAPAHMHVSRHKHTNTQQAGVSVLMTPQG